jgi:hypothetical protein
MTPSRLPGESVGSHAHTKPSSAQPCCGTAEAVPLSLDFSAALTLADGVIERIAREEVTTRRLRYSNGELRVVTFLQNGVALLSLLSYIR